MLGNGVTWRHSLTPLVLGEQLDDLFKLFTGQKGDLFGHPSVERARFKFSDKLLGEGESLIHANCGGNATPFWGRSGIIALAESDDDWMRGLTQLSAFSR
jgi:hypothetical protein